MGLHALVPFSLRECRFPGNYVRFGVFSIDPASTELMYELVLSHLVSISVRDSLPSTPGLEAHTFLLHAPPAINILCHDVSVATAIEFVMICTYQQIEPICFPDMSV
jgi:hypothetical protein